MKKDLIRSLFSMDDEMLTKLINSAAKVAKELEGEFDTDVKNDDKTESYFHSSEKEYDNGKLVKKREKEFVNGECTKDENFDATKAISDDGCKNNGGHCKCGSKTRLYRVLREENEALKNQIEDMTHYIDSLNDKIKELNAENDNLSQIVDNVKRCF